MASFTDQAAEATDSYPDTDSEEEPPLMEMETSPFMLRSVSMTSRGRRSSVMASRVSLSPDWTPPVYPKSEEEEELLRDRVRRNVLMAHLNEAEADTVVKAFIPFSFEAGDCIIRQGDNGEHFFVVEIGTVAVTLENYPEPVMMIDGGHGRDYFGELALLHDAPRAATVTATCPVKAWGLERAVFKRILMQGCHPPMTPR